MTVSDVRRVLLGTVNVDQAGKGGRSNEPDHQAPEPLQIVGKRTLEELLFHWRAVIGAAPKGWARGFALSVQKQSRKAGWQPTARQLQVMQQMVAELFTDHGNEGEVDLIERG